MDTMDIIFIYLYVTGVVFIGGITIAAIGLAILQITEYIEDFLKARKAKKDSEEGKK